MRWAAGLVWLCAVSLASAIRVKVTYEKTGLVMNVDDGATVKDAVEKAVDARAATGKKMESADKYKLSSKDGMLSEADVLADLVDPGDELTLELKAGRLSYASRHAATTQYSTFDPRMKSKEGSGKMPLTDVAQYIDQNLSPSVKQNLIERGLWQENLHADADSIAELESIQQEIKMLANASFHGPFYCRDNDEQIFVSAPPWVAEWFREFPPPRHKCVLSNMNALFASSRVNGFLTSTRALSRLAIFQHGIGRFFGSGTQQNDELGYPSAMAMLDLFSENVAWWIELIHGTVWEDVRHTYWQLRQELSLNGDEVGDLLALHEEKNIKYAGKRIWQSFSNLCMQYYPSNNRGFLHCTHGMGHGLQAMYSALPQGFALASEMCGYAEYAVINQSLPVAKADIPGLAADLAGACIGGAFHSEFTYRAHIVRNRDMNKDSDFIYYEPPFVTDEIHCPKKQGQPEPDPKKFNSHEWIDCEADYVPAGGRAGCYNIYFRFYVGRPRHQQYVMVPHPDFPVFSNPFTNLSPKLPVAAIAGPDGAVTACGHVSGYSRAACMHGFAVTYFCGGTGVRAGRPCSPSYADPMSADCVVPKGGLDDYCGLLKGPKEPEVWRACVAGGSAWSFLSSTRWNNNLPDQKKIVEWCENAMGVTLEAAHAEQFTAKNFRADGCVGREDAGCEGAAFTPVDAPTQNGLAKYDGLEVCVRSAQTNIPGGRISWFGGCEHNGACDAPSVV